MMLILILIFSIIHLSDTSYVLIKQNHLNIEDPLKLLTNADSEEKCIPITIPACKKLGYNNTRLPSNVNLRYLEDVSEYLEIIEKKQCSIDFLFFTCMIYNPICFKNHLKRVLPCKSVCQNVKNDCMDIIQQLGFKWPTELNCETLPDYETDVCIRKKSIIPKTEFDNTPIVFPENNRVDYEPCETKCQSIRPRIRRFRQFKKNHYAVEVQYKSKTKTSNGNYKLTFKISRIFKPGRILLKKYGTFDLWTNSPCLCAKLEFDERYFILGKESMNTDTNGYRMFLTDETIMEKKSYHYKMTLKKWKRRYRKLLEREAKELQRIRNYDQPAYNNIKT